MRHHYHRKRVTVLLQCLPVLPVVYQFDHGKAKVHSTPPPTVLVQSPSLRQVQVAAEWLANHQHKNPDLEVALNLILQGRIVPAETGESVAIAHTSSTDAFMQGDIRGIVMAKPGSLSLEGGDRQTVESLLTLAQLRDCPKRVATSSQTKDWLRPLLLQHYLLEREHNPLVMLCTQVPGGGEGRWALPQDKPVASLC